jgi:hypothetical protein
MAVAILGAQRGIDADTASIFEAWGAAYPKDALGPVGQGLSLIKMGQAKEGFAMVELATQTAETRVDQAKDVLESLKADLETIDA